MKLISDVRGRIIITLILTACSVVVYFTARVDSHLVDSQQISSSVPTSQSESRATLRFTATAYCKGTTTKSGVKVRAGIAAADPQLLPVGSIDQGSIRLHNRSGLPRHQPYGLRTYRACRYRRVWTR